MFEKMFGKNGCVDIGNTQMYYVSFGAGAKKLVVLPGLSDGLATVKGKAILLSAPYRKFMHEYTVYMFSRKNIMPEGYTIRDMAADQVSAMKSLDINKASILGVSQGGMISQYMAIDYPQFIDKLILAVTSPYANEIVKAVVGSWIKMANEGDHVSLMMDTAEKMYSKAYLDKNRKLFPLIARFTKPKSYDRFLKNAYAILDFDAREELGKINCPTLVLSGDDDNTLGNDAPQKFKDAVRDCEVHIYEGLGHGAFEEADDFYTRVYDFCEK